MDSTELRKINLFHNLSNDSLKKIHSMLERRPLKADEILFYEGDIGDELIIIENGEVAIFSMGTDQTHQIIRIFKQGESLGEMALIDEKPRSLGAKAIKDSDILTLNKSAFIKLLSGNDPEIAFALMKELSARVRYTTEFLNKVKAWVQIISKGNYENALNQAKAQSKTGDKMLAALAAEFAQMASEVKEREEALKKEVAQLRITIDQKKRKEDFEDIVQSDYYQELKAKMDDIRKSKE